eukprot:jgi/Bigna1/75089/fgenesh1_pg.32_\
MNPKIAVRKCPAKLFKDRVQTSSDVSRKKGKKSRKRKQSTASSADERDGFFSAEDGSLPLRLMLEEVYLGICEGFIRLSPGQKASEGGGGAGVRDATKERLYARFREKLMGLPIDEFALAVQNPLERIDTGSPADTATSGGAADAKRKNQDHGKPAGDEAAAKQQQQQLPSLSSHYLALKAKGWNAKGAGRMWHVGLQYPPLLARKGLSGRAAFDVLRPYIYGGSCGGRAPISRRKKEDGDDHKGPGAKPLQPQLPSSSSSSSSSFSSSFSSSIRWHRCLVYRDLWSRGFYVTSGANFGVHFLVYKRRPSTHHSSYVLQVVPKERSLTGRRLNEHVRSANSIRKIFVMAFIEATEDRLAVLPQLCPPVTRPSFHDGNGGQQQQQQEQVTEEGGGEKSIPKVSYISIKFDSAATNAMPSS